jgi:hypothetical protein
MEKQKELKAKSGRKPFTYSIGLVKVNEWTNVRNINDKEVEIKSYNAVKAYKDMDGEWTDTSNFSFDELRTLHRVIGMVLQEHDYKLFKMSNNEKKNTE